MPRPRAMLALAGLGLLSACATQPADPADRPEVPSYLPDTDAPLFSTGSTAELALAEELALAHVDAMFADGRLDGVEGLAVRQVRVDALGLAHVRVQQELGGVPVFGGDAVLHLDELGQLRGLSDGFVRGLDVDPTPAWSEDEAIDLALAATEAPEALTALPTAELLALRLDGADHLAWRVSLERLDGSADSSMPRLFIDAHSGALLMELEGLRTATGGATTTYYGGVDIGTYAYTESDGSVRYYLEDTSRGLGTYSFENSYDSLYYVFDEDNVWTSADTREGVDGHYAGAATLDYLLEAHGRDGIDGSGGPGYLGSLTGSGSTISVLVNYGSGWGNAAWGGDYLILGDGDGVYTSALTSVDVVAHEMSHGVVGSSAALVYLNESGAIDESYADVMGAMTERWLFGDSSSVWEIGEEVSLTGSPLRWMDDPTLDGMSSDHYDDRYTGRQDNGGVHLNSGIGNLAFYLLAEGGAHPTYGGSMTGIGADAAADIWYRALTTYLTSSATFSDLRDAQLDAAADLYGSASTEYAAVQDAWHMVGVGEAAPEEEEATTCDGYTDSWTNTLTDFGDRTFEPDGRPYYAAAGDHELALSGPSDTNFNLFLFYDDPDVGWTRVARSVNLDSEESISYTGDAGRYVALVKSIAWGVDNGAGDYELCMTTP